MVLRSIALIALIALLLIGGCKKQAPPPSVGTDFESLMGNQLPAWKYVQTPEDFANVAFFKRVYEKNIQALQQEHKDEKIPRTIHFIWLGPKPFPRESIENVRTWVAHHPDWKIKFWTDRDRPLPHPSMERVDVRQIPFLKLEKYFHGSDNFGEKSDLLRCEILYHEGGIYADHDVKCLKSFDDLNRAYDLYCGMEVPYPTSLSSSVLPTNNILAAAAGHPMLEHMMDWLVEHWEEIERHYPGKDRDATINRVAHRTFAVLGEMFKAFGEDDQLCNIALPTYYFNSPTQEQAIYAQHQYAGTWFENESEFEKMVRKRLMMLSKKTNKLLLGIGVLTGLNLIGWSTALLFAFRRRRS